MLIGLTGQSGAGKSTVSEIFKENGFFVINADLVSKAVADSEVGMTALKKSFGEEYFENGKLNRKKLGALVFENKEMLDKLNNTLLPIISKEIQKIIEKSDSPLILLDAPTLFESGIDKNCDAVISVIAPKNVLINRIMKRDSLSFNDAEKRISSQFSEEFFKENSQIVIENNSTLENLKSNAETALNNLLKKQIYGG